MEPFLSLLRTHWDRAAAIVAAIIGGIALLLGWIGISGQHLPSGQLPYLVSGGLLAVFAVAIAATLWLSADLRDEWRKLDDIHQALVSSVPSRTETAAGDRSHAI